MNMEAKIRPEDGEAAERGRFSRLPAWQRGGLILLPLALAGTGLALANSEPQPIAAPPPPVLTVAAPLVRQINEWDEYIGRFEASRTVEVRPRVSGAVVGVHFRDGDVVRRGQLLFTIDPRPFAAALAEAQAGIQNAQSELALAREDLGRALRLLDVEGVSRSDVDRLRARVRSGEAALAAARARVRARALDLDEAGYPCSVGRVAGPVAPVTRRSVRGGNDWHECNNCFPAAGNGATPAAPAANCPKHC
jgi:multidrug efflux pump subunit AcrA (membrane-fusion protein)